MSGWVRDAAPPNEPWEAFTYRHAELGLLVRSSTLQMMMVGRHPQTARDNCLAELERDAREEAAKDAERLERQRKAARRQWRVRRMRRLALRSGA